jgi:predicted DCC family thiol-disulfide oxidoreductase YuxK
MNDSSIVDSQKIIIVYDGVCGLCNRFVQFVLARDRRDKFLFTPIQGAFASELLIRNGKDSTTLDTVYVASDTGTSSELVRSRARGVLFVLSEIGGVWTPISIFKILPTFVLNAAYDFIAKRRYRWFGKLDACPIPTAENRRKFISLDS